MFQCVSKENEYQGFSGSKLKEARNTFRISRLTLANRIGCTAMSVYNWEIGKKLPNSNLLKRAAEVLGKNMEDFYA